MQAAYEAVTRLAATLHRREIAELAVLNITWGDKHTHKNIH